MDFDSLSEREQLDILGRVTSRTIERLLEIKSIYDVTTLQIDKLRSDWRAVEDSLHANYSIRGAGVIAVMGSAGIEGLPDDDFLITDEPTSPENIVPGLGQFPLEAATCAYVFTILENYGDDVVALFNPEFFEERRSWHREVRAGKSLGKGKKARLQIAGFSLPFEFDPDVVPQQPVLNLMLIKKERNSFAHDGKMKMRLEEFFRRTLEVICYIALAMDPDQEVLIVHRTEDHSGRFAMAEEVREGLIRERGKE